MVSRKVHLFGLAVLGVLIGAVGTACDFTPGSKIPYETDSTVLTAPAPMDSSAPINTSRYSLEDAASQSMVEYSVEGVGENSGESLFIAIKRSVARDIDVFVTPGTVFMPANSGAQRMVAWGVASKYVSQEGDAGFYSSVTSMYLPDLEQRYFMVEAYCLDLDLDIPKGADVFEPIAAVEARYPEARTLLDVRSAQIMYEGKKRGLSVEGIQTAIWADRDHKTRQEIEIKYAADAKEMDEAFDMLLNMPPPEID